MKKKLKLILATTLASVAVLTAAGVTLAVGVSDNSSTGSLTTADIKLTARAENLKAYTAVPAAGTDEGAFEENGATYKYEAGVAQSASVVGFPHGGGSVSYDSENITIAGFLPGDKVEFDIAVTSTSSIAFDYRAELWVDARKGEKLLNQLEFSAGGLGINRRSADDVTAEAPLNAVMTDYTEWKAVGSGSDRNIERVHVTVRFPVAATEGDGETVKFTYRAIGQQIIEERPDVAELTHGEEKKTFKRIAEAVAYAEENGITEIRIVDRALIEEGNVPVSHALRFVGVKQGDGALPAVEGARFAIKDGAGVSFENIRFSGESYIDVSDATEVVLKNCTVDAKLVKAFDTVTRNYLAEAAFVVSGESPAPVKLTVSDCNFATTNGAAVYLCNKVRNGSAFTGNVFGAEGAVYAGTAVALNGGDAAAVVRFENNEFRAKLPLSLGRARNGAKFTVISANNRATGAESVFVGGVADAAFFDSGSKLGENALTVADIASSNLLVGGVDVAVNDRNRAFAGKFALGTATSGEFYFGFVAVETLSQNAVAVYRGGTLYSYINSNGDTFAETVVNG